MKIIITGGAGFIGSHLVRLFVKKYPLYKIINLDKLTYAGNLENISDVEDSENCNFVRGDICDRNFIMNFFEKENPDSVIHLAAETHVDRSIENPLEFVNTNILGTLNLLDACRNIWKNMNGKLFYHVSTDEVYGTLGSEGKFSEQTRYDPHSPYAASKAASDHFVKAYFTTFNIPIKISNCSNNFGSHQFPEKLIPVCINQIKNKKPIPVYGQGLNIRDWLWVEDHVKAIDKIFHEGKIGETYNVGGNNEWKNIELVEMLCDICDELLGREKNESKKLITFVTDRAGHDFRYAIDATKIYNQLNFQPEKDFKKVLKETVKWYLEKK